MFSPSPPPYWGGDKESIVIDIVYLVPLVFKFPLRGWGAVYRDKVVEI